MRVRSRLAASAVLATLSLACSSPTDPAADDEADATSDTASSESESDSSGDASESSESAASSESTASSETGGDEALPQPDWLVVYTTGNPDDAAVDPLGPGLLLMGGGVDVDAAFAWQSTLLAGGDVVVLRSSGEDGYNDYLFTDIGGIDSVQTILADSSAAASDPWVAWTVAHAEAVFMAGGDQADYYELWKGTPVAAAIMTVHERGGVVGGTSAGLAVMGEWLFSAIEGTVYPEEVLADPYNRYMTFGDEFLAFPLLAGVITDSHFAQRDRMGRLLGFTARVIADAWTEQAIGLGIDEQTAMVIGPDGVGEVLGEGGVFILRADMPAAQCSPGLALEYGPLEYAKLVAGDTASWPGGVTEVPSQLVSAGGGVTDPADPY